VPLGLMPAASGVRKRYLRGYYRVHRKNALAFACCSSANAIRLMPSLMHYSIGVPLPGR
jgi:hypothetical protein